MTSFGAANILASLACFSMVCACKSPETARLDSQARSRAEADGGPASRDAGIESAATLAETAPKLRDAGTKSAAAHGGARAEAAPEPETEDAGPSLPTDAAPQPSADTPLRALQVTESQALAAVVGAYGPNRSAQQFYAADLGWAVKDHEKLWILFGDSWANPFTTQFEIAAGQDADDALGYIDLEMFPNGESVEQWIAAHPAPAGAFAWQAEPPTLNVVVNERGIATPIRAVRDGTPLSSGPALVPITGFSNERSDDSAGMFAVFWRNGPVECAAGACDNGLTCDDGLGVCVRNGQARNDTSMPCVLGSEATMGCDRCEAVPGAGLCVDTKVSLYDADSARGRSASVPVTHEVGNLVRGSDHLYATRPWVTKRFYNATSRTVRDFDPTRARGAGNDYRPADGSQTGHDGVFLWGRPSFGGVHKAGRDAQLYLAWVPMPSYAQNGQIDWAPRYYAGQDEQGRPRFSAREIDSIGLDLDAATSGDQPRELVDVTNQMAVSYLPGLEQWIMVYGGDLYGAFLELLYIEDAALVDGERRGPLYVRYAKHPWGPWTAPEIFLEDGERSEPSGQYASGGILRSTGCSGTCVRGEFNLGNDEGWLYGPAIIDPWTIVRDGGVDLFWHVSTWNPYQVVLMKSSLRPRAE